MPTASAPFRVLVADDTSGWLQIAQQQLDGKAGIELRTAADPAGSIAAINEEVFHLAFIDLEQPDGAAGGRRILEYLRDHAPSCRRLVITRYSDRYAGDIVGLSTPEVEDGSPLSTLNPLAHGIIDKGRVDRFFAHYALPAARAWQEREFSASGRDAVEKAISTRRSRIPGLRATSTAIKDEVEILLRRIFGGIIGVAGQDRLSQVELTLLTGGFSSAVVFSAVPQVGVDATGAPITGNACVVKVGPAADIREEALRYDKVVRYGVILEHRVELLSTAYADALGAICYSFAGGSSAKPTSLDDALARRDKPLVESALSQLFDTTNKSWYSVVAPTTSLSEFFKREYGFDVADEIPGLIAWARKRSRSGKSRAYLSTDGEHLSLGSVEVPLPRVDIAGHPALAQQTPSCLIHGDLHGGNVMISADRVSMIDYRHSGTGPRLVDIACLQSTVRLHDPVAKNSIQSEEDATSLAKRMYRDRVVIRDAFAKMGRGRLLESRAAEAWESFAFDLNDRLAANFENVTTEEYLASHLMMALRVASVKTLDDSRRLRVLCWVGALIQAIDQEKDVPYGAE